MTVRRIGLALGSGSARGWAHIGVIKALAGHGIHPHVVCGSSIGALVGAAYVTGELDALEAWVRRITWPRIARLADFKFTHGGLIEGDRLMRTLRHLHEDALIESLNIPFAAVAADLVTGHEVWLREGSLVDAVRASMALPGIFSPIPMDDWRLADGGLVNPVPVAPCRALGADVIIAVNLNGDLVGRRVHRRNRARSRRSLRAAVLDRLSKEVPNGLRNAAGLIAPQLLGTGTKSLGYFDVIFGAINVMQDRITRNRMAGDPPDVMLSPGLRQIGLLEFNRAEEAIEEGHAAVDEMLPALEQAVGPLRCKAPRRHHGR
jgi:NTE family protein